MKLIVSREELLPALEYVAKGLSSRSTLPILAGIQIQADKTNEIFISSTDLELSVKCYLNGLIEKNGTVVIPGRLFINIIKNLPNSAISLSLEGEGISITCGHSFYTLKTMKVDDFPEFPEIKEGISISLPAETLTSAISKVVKAVSRDETRPVLTGILLSISNSKLTAVATDSYRLAIMETDIKKTDISHDVIFPGKTIEEITKLTTEGQEVNITFTDNQVLIETQNVLFVTRRIEGTFPNYKQLIPSSFQTKIIISKEEFISAARRVSLLAQNNTSIRLAVDETDKKISLTATTQDIGTANEIISTEVDGLAVEIAFNHLYLLDGVITAPGDTISIEIVSPLKPGVIRAMEDKGFMYLIMPVRLV